MDGWFNPSIEGSINICRFVKQGWNALITSGIFDLLGREPKTFKNYVQDYVNHWVVPVAETE